MNSMTIFCLLALGFVAACNGDVDLDRRFILDDFKKVIDKVKEKVHEIGDTFSEVYKQSQTEFENEIKKVASTAVSFNDAVKKLAPLIKHDATKKGCATICATSAAVIIGPEVKSIASTICGPLCDAALEQLANAAAQGK